MDSFTGEPCRAGRYLTSPEIIPWRPGVRENLYYPGVAILYTLVSL